MMNMNKQHFWQQPGEMCIRDRPQVVLDVLKGEAYNSFSIASVQYIEYASGSDVYHFVLQKEHSMDISVEIDPQGNLVLD